MKTSNTKCKNQENYESISIPASVRKWTEYGIIFQPYQPKWQPWLIGSNAVFQILLVIFDMLSSHGPESVSPKNYPFFGFTLTASAIFWKEDQNINILRPSFTKVTHQPTHGESNSIIHIR